MRKLLFFVLLAAAISLSACSSGGSDSPADTSVHPQSWFATHATEVSASPDYGECKTCHGQELTGSGDAVSCYSCHSYNTEPPFLAHPPSWTNPYLNHRSYAALNGYLSCNECHGSDLRGYQTAPSCYSSSFNGAACHADGPQGVPHPIDDGSSPPNESYLLGANHGPDAKANLTSCQQCHGQAGAPGTSPRFNIGINSVGGQGCEPCHGVNYAHPPNWPVCTGHSTASNIQNACTLCHGVNLDGVNLDNSPSSGSSCLDCHNVSPGLDSAACVSCHGTPPKSEDPVGAESPNLAGQHARFGHTVFISETPADTCDRCHSGFGSCTPDHFDTSRPSDVTLPYDPLDTIIPVWNGSNMTCNGNCHVTGPNGDFDVFHSNSNWY